MTVEEVIGYLIDKNLFKSAQVSFLGKGFSKEVFLVEADEKKYSFMVPAKDIPQEDFFSSLNTNLNFLHQEGISFAPTPFYFDAEEKILLVSYLEGDHVGVGNLNDKQLEQYVSQLNTLHDLKFADYQVFCSQEGFECIPPESPLSRMESHEVKTFAFLQEQCPDKKVVDWIGPRLEKNLEVYRQVKYSPRDVIFSHGDLASSNILIKGTQMVFIDWDRSKFLCTKDYGLPYVFLYCGGETEVRRKLIALYSKYRHLDPEELKTEVRRGLKFLKLNDVVWAAGVYTRMVSQETAGWERYRNLTFARIKEFEELALLEQYF